MAFKRKALAFAIGQVWALSVSATEAPQTASTDAAQSAETKAPSAVISAIPAAEPASVFATADVPAPTVQPTAVAIPAPQLPMTPVPLSLPEGVHAPEAKPIAEVPGGVRVLDDATEQAEVEALTQSLQREYKEALSVPPSDLWDRIRAGYALNPLDDEYVRKWEQFYANKPDYMQRIVERGSKYMFYIVTEVERRGMPLEIALLPVVESAFVTNANSSAAAAGIWQFIPSTGKIFGMKQDWWADSRRDIVAATKGALDYLEKLHGMFGDWHLALAAYNWGEGAVQRAINQNQAAGKPTDYASLYMPNETRNYVPKLIAVRNIVANPGAFGLNLASIPNQPYFKTVTLARHIDVDRAVKLADISKEEFVALNPAHNRPVIGGRDQHHVLLPADKADNFIAHLESDDKPQVSWMAYKTKIGDKLDALARKFGATIDTLRAVNGIRIVPPTLPAGYNLLVPTAAPSEEALGSLQNAVFTKLPEYIPPPPMPRIHRVAKSETLAAVAKRYGISVGTLAKWNRLSNSARVKPGVLLAVSGPMPMATRLVRVKQGGRYVTVKQTAPAVRMVKGKGGKGKFVLAKHPGGKKVKPRRSRG